MRVCSFDVPMQRIRIPRNGGGWNNLYSSVIVISCVACPKCGAKELAPVGENRYLCRSCGFIFYSCPVCGAAFEMQQQYAAHLKSHKRRRNAWQEVMSELRELRRLLEEILERQERILRRLEATTELRTVPATAPEASEVPEFVKNNPWLAVLARRGEA